MLSEPVTVQTPASTSNCGPGFDTLGIALELYNFVRVQAVDGKEVRYAGDEAVGEDTLKMVNAAVKVFREHVEPPAHGIEFDIWGDLPIARGLGSSATLRAGIVGGLNAIHGYPLDKESLTGLVCRLDHSPDNTCPLIQGGFCVARIDPRNNRYLYALRHEVGPEIKFVVISPNMHVLTADAREILPDRLPFKDVVRSINSVSALVSIFATRRYELLEHAVSDYIHQPYREKLNPFSAEAIRAGIEAGAYCGWLSGSGSSVLCVARTEAADAVETSMMEIFASRGIETRAFKLNADNTGLRIV